MSSVSWNVDADGDWSTAANWSTKAVPTSASDVTINTVDLHTVTISGGANAVHSLTVGNDHFVMSGGSLEVLATASFANGFTQTGGALLAGAVSITGPGVLTGGAAEGNTAFTVGGNIALANYTLGGAASIANSATLNQTGQITLGDNTGVGAAIQNAAGARYLIAGDFGVTEGAASATIVNHGLLEKSAGAGVSAIGANVTSNGTITVLSGQLQFDGPSNVLSGKFSGAGQISFGGGVTTLSKATVSVGSMGLYGTATLNLGSALTLTGSLYDLSNGTNTLNLGANTLTLGGAGSQIYGSFGSANLIGTGTLANTGGLSLSNTDIGGKINLTNTGTIHQVGNVTFGDGSGAAPTISNAATGLYDIDSAVTLGESGATVTFANAGTIAQTVGGVGHIGVVVQNTGTIDALQGTIEIDNALVDSGAITGPGAISILGTATLNKGASLSVAQVDLYGTGVLNLGTSIAYGGVFNDSSNGTDYLHLGASTLTLSGVANTIFGNFGSAVVDGSGVLANSGRLTLGDAVIGGTVQLSNTGTILQTAVVTFGDGSGAAPSIVNASKGVFNLTTSEVLGQNGATVTFANAGLLEETGAGAVARLGVVVQNTGTLAAAGGTIEVDNSLVNTGVITGTGAMNVIGAVTLNAGTTLSVAQVGLYGTGVLNFGTSLTYAGVFTDSSNGTDYLHLSANALKLNNAADVIFGNFGAAVVDGSGSLYNLATLTLGDAVIGGALKVYNSGVVNQTAIVTIGDGSGQVASIINGAGKTYNLSGAVTLNNGAASASSFKNSGAFNVAAGLGVATIATSFYNLTGATINVTSGALQDNGALVNTGAITGARLIINSQANFNAGSKLTVGEIDLYGTAGLTLGASLAYAGEFVDATNGSTTLDLGANTFTLSGEDTFQSSFGDAIVTGTGTLALTGQVLVGGGPLILGGKATLNDTGTVTATGAIQVGDAGPKAATAVIGAGGVWDLTADSAGVGRGASAASQFINNGLFEKTAGTGVSVVSARFVNNGTITVTSGVIEFLAGDLTGAGVINGVISHDADGDTFVAAVGSGPAVARLAQTAAGSLVSNAAISSAPASPPAPLDHPLVVGRG